MKTSENNSRKIPLPISPSVNCQMPVAMINPARKSLIFLWYIGLLFYTVAKIVKSIKNIFTKPLARKKNLCIFALGFTITVDRTKSRY